MNKKDCLFVSEQIMCSHDDVDIYYDAVVGYNERLELVVRLSISDYDERGKNISEVYVTRDDAYALSRRLNVRMLELPSRLARCAVVSRRSAINPPASEIRDSFREVIARLDYYHCPYRWRHMRWVKDSM